MNDNTMNDISKALQISDIDEAVRLGEIFAESGYFDGAQEASQAVVKILAGAELGISAMAAMRGIYVIDGNTSLSAALIGTLLRRHPTYDYEVQGVNDQGAKIAFFRDGEKIGVSTFTRSDAQNAGLMRKHNWQNYFKDMTFARAMSRGCRRFCPEVFSGAVYTPEEVSRQGPHADPVTESDLSGEGELPQSGDGAPALPEGAQDGPENTPESARHRAPADAREKTQRDVAAANEAFGLGEDPERDPAPDKGEEYQKTAREATKQRAEENGAPERTISKKQIKRLWAIGKNEGGYSDDGLRRMVAREFGFDPLSDITREKYDSVVDYARDEGMARRYNRDPDTPDMFDESEGEGEAPYEDLVENVLEEMGAEVAPSEHQSLVEAAYQVTQKIGEQEPLEEKVQVAEGYLAEVEHLTDIRRAVTEHAAKRFGIAPLPEDFPHRDLLAAGGLWTLQSVDKALRTGELGEIEGIGQKRRDQVEEERREYDFPIIQLDGKIQKREAAGGWGETVDWDEDSPF